MLPALLYTQSHPSYGSEHPAVLGAAETPPSPNNSLQEWADG